MTDEGRLVDAVATAWYGGVTEHWRLNATNVIKRMREQKITLTPPPAPEPMLRMPLVSEDDHSFIVGCIASTIGRMDPEEKEKCAPLMWRIAHESKPADSETE